MHPMECSYPLRPPGNPHGIQITVIPRLLECLVLDGAVVTIDAVGCQRAIVKELQAAGADHVLAVKRNQPTLHAKVRAAFEEADRGAFTPEVQDHCETVERNGGRRERRTCTVLGGPGLCARVTDPTEWPGLCRLIRVRTERRGPGMPRSSWSWFGATGASRTAGTAPWDVQSREDDCRLRTGPP